MKKLFSMASLVLLAIFITGCTEENTKVECNEGFEVVEGTCEEITCETGQVLEGNTCVDEETIDLTFVFTDYDGTSETKEIQLDDEYDGTFVDVLNQEFDVAIMDSDYGSMLLGIEGYYPLSGSYIAIGKNGEMSMVGVDDMTFEDGDSFSFDLVWWMPSLQGVYEGIDLFLENQIGNYVSSDYIDYNVLSALNLLGLTEEYITAEEVGIYIETAYPTPTTYADYFKIMVMKSAVGLDVGVEAEALNSIAATGVYGQTALTVLGLDLYEQSSGSFDSAASGYFIMNPATLSNLDGAGLDLIAYSVIGGDDMNTLTDNFYTALQGVVLPTGGIKTADTEWDGIVYPGTENAASMSMVILGLIANDISPETAELTTEEGYNLITRLLEFQTESGTFDWVLTDDVLEDTAFSTPQAFLALASYHVYMNQYSAVNPYHFVTE